jgi:hypothetical protein
MKFCRTSINQAPSGQGAASSGQHRRPLAWLALGIALGTVGAAALEMLRHQVREDAAEVAATQALVVENNHLHGRPVAVLMQSASANSS